eukprot:g7683.t1
MPAKGKKRARCSLAKGTPSLKSLWQRQGQSQSAPSRAAPAPRSPPPPPAPTERAAAAPAPAPECRHTDLPGGTGNLRFWPQLLTDDAQKRLFKDLTHPDLRPIKAGGGGADDGGAAAVDLRDGGRWAQRPISVAGKEVLQPRLTCSFGKEGVSYKYSGKILRAAPWDGMPAIQEILCKVERAVGRGPGVFNYVLLNWYRDGDDYMGWHADDESDLDEGAPIASVSLGDERRFRFRRKNNHSEKLEFILRGGSLLIMEGSTQKHWQHHVPKRAAKEGGTAVKQVAGQTKLSFGKASAGESGRKHGTATGAAMAPSDDAAEGVEEAAAGAAAGGGGGGGRRERGRERGGARQDEDTMTGRINLTFRRVTKTRRTKDLKASPSLS